MNGANNFLMRKKQSKKRNRQSTTLTGRAHQLMLSPTLQVLVWAEGAVDDQVVWVSLDIVMQLALVAAVTLTRLMFLVWAEVVQGV